MNEIKSLYTPSAIQQEAHLCDARETLIGGSAGPGKTTFLIMDPIVLQLYIEHERVRRGEIEKSSGWAIHFRREIPMLAQTISKARLIYPKIDPSVKYNDDAKTFTFSCGYRIQFAHMAKPTDWEGYDSSEYCVAEGTPIRMSDGSFRNIEDIQVGDYVATLSGPKRVSALAQPRHTHCVRADVYLGHDIVGTQYHPTTHPVLTSASDCRESSSPTSRTSLQFPSEFSTWLDYESHLCGRRESPGKRVSIVDAESGHAKVGGTLREFAQLRACSFPVVLHAPTARQCLSERQTSTQASKSSARSEAYADARQTFRLPVAGSDSDLAPSSQASDLLRFDAPGYPSCGCACAPRANRTVQDSQSHCCPGHRPCGEQLQSREGIGQDGFPSPTDASSHIPWHHTTDGPHASPGCTLGGGPYTYRNFYTGQMLAGTEEIALGTCVIAPAGKLKVFDITVEGVNHYISSVGLINLNTWIGYDELRQFEKEQYTMLTGRCRTSDPVLRKLLRIRAATNPDPGWVREYFVDPAPGGRKRLAYKVALDDGTEEVRHKVYIPARLSDNPDKAFVRDYEITLRNLPTHIMKARLYGDWYVIQGAFFADEWKTDVHVVKPFEIPSGWTKFRSMDWGYKTWCAVLWWAVDTEGNMVCYRERSYHLKDADEVAFRIREIETEAGEWDLKNDCSSLTGPADTQIWEQRGTIGPTIQETFASYGVYWQKCTKNRAAAAAQLIKRLKDIPGTNSTGSRPGITWFDTCVQSIKTIPSLPTDKTDDEVPEKGGEDHWLDATFYACMHRAAIPKHDEKERRRRGNIDDLEEAREKRANRGRLGYGGH